MKALCQVADGLCTQCGQPRTARTRTTCPAWLKARQRFVSTIRRRVLRYLRAILRWIASGLQRRSKREVARLLAVCQACEHFTPDESHADRGRCEKCGCSCSASGVWFNKLAMATERCPLDPPKWTAQTTPGVAIYRLGQRLMKIVRHVFNPTRE